MMIRFKIDEEKKKEWIESQRKKKEEEQRRICPYAPKINKKSKKINLKFKDDFFGRQKLKDEQKKKKEEKLKEYLNKKKEDEINKNNFLLTKNNKGKNKDNNLNNSINLSTSKTSAKTLEKNRKIEIKNAINKLYEWDTKRKEKINQKRKNNDEKMEKNSHIPKINKRSSSMAELKKEKYSDKNIFDRLSKKDPVSLEKKKLLVELYTPSFQPNIYTKRSTKKEKDINEDKNEIEEKKEKEEGNIYEKFGIDNNSAQYINDEDIQQLYRDVLFRNKKKNKMYEN
jgi:centrosomal protein CEP76